MHHEVISTICRLSESFIINKYPSIREKNGAITVKGLYFKIVVRCDNYGYDKNDEYHEDWYMDERRVMHFIVTSNYNVFLAVTDFSEGHAIPAPEKFKNTSNHNSCWRSDGFSDVHSVGYDLWKMCWVRPEIPEDKRKNMRESVHYSASYILSELFKPVEISHVALDDENSFGYHRKIVNITKKKATYIIED